MGQVIEDPIHMVEESLGVGVEIWIQLHSEEIS